MGRIMGVPRSATSIPALAGDAGGLIKIAEAFHERKFAEVADTIYDAHLRAAAPHGADLRPLQQGKTTSAKRLGIQWVCWG